MASVTHNSAISRLRCGGNTTAAKLLAQNTALDAISKDAQRIAASQRFLHVQSLARNLGLAMGLPLLLSGAAFLLPPSKAFAWAAASPSLGQEGGLYPYAAGKWLDNPNMYLQDEEEEDFSRLIDADQQLEEERSSTVDDNFPAPADSELSFTESQPATTDDGPPEVRQKNAEASTGEEDAKATPPEKDDASTLGERGEASEYNGPLPNYTLPAAAGGSDLDEKESKILNELPAAAPGSDIDDVVAETSAKQLSRVGDLLLTSAMPRGEAINISATDNGPANTPAVDILETEEEPEGEDEKGTVMESSGPTETGAAPEFQPDEEDELSEAATGATGGDESVIMPNETSVPIQNVPSSLESEPQLSVRDPHSQPTNDHDTVDAEEELRDVAPLDTGFSEEELQVKSTTRAGVSASRGQMRKSHRNELPRKEMRKGKTLGQQSRQTRGRSHRAAAVYAEEEHAERTQEKTKLLRGTVKGASRKNHKEMNEVPWKYLVGLAVALGVASAGAEAGLMRLNRS